MTRIAEILIMSFGVLAFWKESAIAGYLLLFFLATHSAFFSPCKFGIIPEIVPKDKISQKNGVLTATTYLAIILGTFLASFLTELTHKNFVLASLFCVLVAFLAGVASLGIPKTLPKAKEKKVSVRFITEIFITLKNAKKIRYLFSTLIFGAYFLFIGAYTQLNIIPFTLQSLHLSEVGGGYLFLMTAIGIGIGAFLAGRFSGKQVELGFIPFAVIGMSLCFISLYFFASSLTLVILSLLLTGLFGGFFIVPIDAFIQVASPEQDRGQNVAAGNFLNFIGVIFAAFLIYFFGTFLKLQASQGFLIVGIVTALLALILFLTFLDQVLRLVVAKIATNFWHLHSEPQPLASQPTLYVTMRRSWLDTLVVMAILPRLMRYIVPITKKIFGRRFFYHRLRLIFFDHSSFYPLHETALKEIKAELALGHSICLMQPIYTKIKSIDAWTAEVKSNFTSLGVPVVPILIHRKAYPQLEKGLFSVKRLFKSKIHISYGN